MKYIVHKRFKDKAICGDVNLPAMTPCECKGNMIYLEDNQPLCVITSDNAHKYFAFDEDGKGMERGKLTQKIIKKLTKRDNLYQDRWDKVWKDAKCQRYKRVEHEDYWLWNHLFYNAPIEDLKYIAELVGA